MVSVFDNRGMHNTLLTTVSGFINNGKIPYKDASGCSLDQQALVFKVTLPRKSRPLIG